MLKNMILYTYSAGLLWQAQQCANEWTDQMAGFLRWMYRNTTREQLPGWRWLSGYTTRLLCQVLQYTCGPWTRLPCKCLWHEQVCDKHNKLTNDLSKNPEDQPVYQHKEATRKRSGSVVECLTRDRGAAGSSLIGVVSLSKTHKSYFITGSTQEDPSLYNWKIVDGT